MNADSKRTNSLLKYSNASAQMETKFKTKDKHLLDVVFYNGTLHLKHS
jgi:hypothetical protein